MDGIWSITYPEEEGKICIIDCTYFSLQVNMSGKPSVFKARSESPKIQEAYHSFSKNI